MQTPAPPAPLCPLTGRRKSSCLISSTNRNSFLCRFYRPPSTRNTHWRCTRDDLKASAQDPINKEVDGACQFRVHNVEILMPVVVMAQLAIAVGNTAQADQRHGEAHGGTKHREGFHIDHVGIDRFI